MPAITKYDLLIKAAPNSRLHNGRQFVSPKDIGIKDGKVVTIAENIELATADNVLQTTGLHIICPGLIDIHTHFAPRSFWGEGMDVDRDALHKGTILVVDAGSDGYLTFESDLLEQVINNKEIQAKTLAFINIAPNGLKKEREENYDLSGHSVSNTVRVANNFRDQIVGVKIRFGWLQTLSSLRREALTFAKLAASEIKKPLMIHIGHGPSIREIIDILDGFDQPIIITHCFHGHYAGSVLKYTKAEWDEMINRGVLFDLGNGDGSYSHDTAIEALSRGFKLFTVSTDLHKVSKPKKAQNLPHCMSKVMSAGVKLEDVITMSTYNPALAVNVMEKYGLIEEGRDADLSILEHRVSDEEPFRFVDYQFYSWKSSEGLLPAYVIKGGKLLELKGQNSKNEN